jgi:hypothetical protein
MPAMGWARGGYEAVTARCAAAVRRGGSSGRAAPRRRWQASGGAIKEEAVAAMRGEGGWANEIKCAGKREKGNRSVSKSLLYSLINQRI